MNEITEARIVKYPNLKLEDGPSKKTQENNDIVIGEIRNKIAQGFTRISFICQRCLKPIKLDESFYSIDEFYKANIAVPLQSNIMLKEMSACDNSVGDESVAFNSLEHLPLNCSIPPFKPFVKKFLC